MDLLCLDLEAYCGFLPKIQVCHQHVDGPGEEQYLAVPVLLSNVRKCFENLDGMGARDWQSC